MNDKVFDKLESILPKESWDWGICWVNGSQQYYCLVVYGEEDIKKSAMGINPMQAVEALQVLIETELASPQQGE